MTARVLRRRFTVDEYHRMAETGILGEDDRVELIEGEIVEMAPIGSRHAACVIRLIRLFSARPRPDVLVNVQNPIRISEYTEPQPDLTLLRFRPDFYARAHPGPEDVLLLVEVAESSAEYDRQVKLPLYARGGLREVWLVDLEGEAVEVYRGPSSTGYTEVQRRERGQTLAPTAVPDLILAVDEILGPAPAGDAAAEP